MLAEFKNLMIRLEQTIPRCMHVRTKATLKESDCANEFHLTTARFQNITGKCADTLARVFPRLASP